MFSVRPVFIGWIVLLCQLPIQLFLTFWSAFFFGSLVSSFHFFPRNSPVPFVLFGAVAFFGVPVVMYYGKKLNYARTVYKFTEDQLEFEEGFFTINEKIIKFKDVAEVTLRKNIFQRLYGLGSIYLATRATGSFGRTNIFAAFGFGNISASGVGVCDVSNPDETFARVRGMIDSQTA